jgi:hypothetical protein
MNNCINLGIKILTVACQHASLLHLKTLVSAGANLDIQDNEGKTALYYGKFMFSFLVGIKNIKE